MSQELLTAVLGACTDFHRFLTVDLQGETLAPRVEVRREKLILSANDIITKLRSAQGPALPHPHRPLANGEQSAPVIGRKPVPKPPAPAPPGQEMYAECEGQEAPEDYLAFEAQRNNEDDEQENYEAMTADQPLDLYEEPVQGVLSPPTSTTPHPSQPHPSSQPPAASEDGQQELYEEPTMSPPPPPGGHTPTPPISAENSGSGAVYARTNIVSGAPPNETATEWMYDAMKKDEKRMKASQLENILCRGNLEKLGGKNKKTWQVRFCVLSGPFMYFYEKENSKTYRNRITLPMYTPAEAPEYTTAKKRNFAFKLTHTDTAGKKKDYYFRSSKRESCDTWLKSVRTANERTIINPQQQIVMTTPTDTTGGGTPGPDGQQEMYEPIEPMGASDEEEEEEGLGPDQEDYVDVIPAPQEDQEDYIDVAPQPQEDEIQEEYEDTSQFMSTPAPGVPPPFSSHRVPSHNVPSRRPDPPVDTSRIYTAPENGINLQHVFVALWDFAGSQKDELSVQRGDLVLVVNPDPSLEWWAGEGLDANAATKTGSFGFLPSTYFMAAFQEVA